MKFHAIERTPQLVVQCTEMVNDANCGLQNKKTVSRRCQSKVITNLPSVAPPVMCLPALKTSGCSQTEAVDLSLLTLSPHCPFHVERIPLVVMANVVVNINPKCY